ncbi:hypothetical protein CBR_g19586 [Chara braunii]|uniref:Uncharacterized protein n=1 Tax=Chara braunii TaxID=69332 RepID=A0A388KYQ1_CHABU|nr:hypothetical protein CBR_g19586 [Chara braunii]|eukprot:GBG75073.1 hypothetical protein CBR_g19586 [Chara braunii]
MLSRNGNRGKKRDSSSCEGDTPVAVKKGRHVAKNKKALAEGPSKGSGARDDEWVRDSDGADNDEDFVSDTEVETVRQAFWNETEGNGLFKLIQEAQLYLPAIARGVSTPEIHRSIALPHSSIPQHKIDDELQLKVAKDRAIKVQSIALCVIHGWIFKSASHSRGYHSTYGYMLNHVAADIARIMWLGEDRRTRVIPAVNHITLEMDMKLHVWFVDVHIENRHEDDELACYQEATLQHLVGAFTSAVGLGKGIDGSCISYDRLRNIVEAMRVLLVVSMWLMRMSGDDLRSHFDA